ncbi:MAG: RNA pyrophosphohydrolase [Pelagibacterium sp. SCN 64-44]|nr:MAG: RNA pyrophosphohydrolase [Pelagibacterium sp. SCN 64-44]
MPAPDRESLPYRDCVGVALFNADGLVLIGRRRPEQEAEGSEEIAAPWQMPQGGIDKGEDPLKAALRELEEETSVRSVSLLAELPEWVHYDLPDAALGIALKGRYRGQRQRWFAFAFTGPDSEIDVLSPGGGRFKPEFDAWRWERLEQTPGLIVPFKKDAYRTIAAGFADIPARFTRP